VHGAGSNASEYSGCFHESWLRTIARAGRELTEIVASPTVDFAHRRDTAGVLVARSDSDEPLIGRHAGRSSAIVARTIAELSGVVRAPAVQITGVGHATGVVPTNRQRSKAKVTLDVGGSRAR
jgi:hypothetical protein